MTETDRRTHPAVTPATAPIPTAAWLNLALATVGIAVNFWAWGLISPLGPTEKELSLIHI